MPCNVLSKRAILSSRLEQNMIIPLEMEWFSKVRQWYMLPIWAVAYLLNHFWDTTTKCCCMGNVETSTVSSSAASNKWKLLLGKPQTEIPSFSWYPFGNFLQIWLIICRTYVEKNCSKLFSVHVLSVLSNNRLSSVSGRCNCSSNRRVNSGMN